MAMTKTVAVAAFRKACAQLIARVGRDREPITITKHGRPVAMLAPVPAPGDGDIQLFGALKGSVSAYDDPFAPAADPGEWDAMR